MLPSRRARREEKFWRAAEDTMQPQSSSSSSASDLQIVHRELYFDIIVTKPFSDCHYHCFAHDKDGLVYVALPLALAGRDERSSRAALWELALARAWLPCVELAPVRFGYESVRALRVVADGRVPRHKGSSAGSGTRYALETWSDADIDAWMPPTWRDEVRAAARRGESVTLTLPKPVQLIRTQFASVTLYCTSEEPTRFVRRMARHGDDATCSAALQLDVLTERDKPRMSLALVEQCVYDVAEDAWDAKHPLDAICDASLLNLQLEDFDDVDMDTDAGT